MKANQLTIAKLDNIIKTLTPKNLDRLLWFAEGLLENESNTTDNKEAHCDEIG